MKTFKSVCLAFLFMSCYIGEELPPDQQVWEYDDPANVGLFEESLLFLDSAIFAFQYQNIEGLIIIKDDKMVFENYYGLQNRSTEILLDRASIVLTVAAIGIAIDQGLVNVTDPIHTYLPSYSAPFQEDPDKREVTIEHLLTHRSGFSWNETLSAFIGNPENNLNQMFASADWIDFILNQPLEAPPGLRYNFNSGTGIVLATIIQNVSGQPFDEYLNENLFSTIEVSSFSMDQDPAGNFDGGRGASMTLIDWTKFGYMMLNDGLWDGRKVIDPNFVDEVTSVQSSVSPSFNLGYGWWLFGSNFQNSFPFDKDDIFYIPGDAGQHQYIVPSQNLIVSINAENLFFGFGNPSLNLFFQITSALQ